jgi:DNA polymerase-1
MGLPLVMIDGVEADDVIGTLVCEARAKGMDVVVSTGDKDMAQLVVPGVTLVNTMSDTVLDEAGVAEKFGVPPNLIIDYLALIGDTSDNVPGVPKVGPKTAVKWLQHYGTLDGIIAHANEIKGVVGENLRASLAHLPLSRELVTIRCDVPLSFGLSDLQRLAPDRGALKALYTRFEFKNWLAELLGEERVEARLHAKPPETGVVDHHAVTTWEEFQQWLERLSNVPLFAFDTETTSLDYMQAEIVGVSFAVDAGTAVYVPLRHDCPGAPDQLDREQVLSALKPILEDESRHKLGHNLKYDRSVLLNHGIELRGIAHDTMLESYVLDSTASRHDLDSLSLKYLGRKTILFEEVAGKGAKQLTFNQVPVAEATAYAAEDADVALQLHRTLWPRLEQEAELKLLYSEVEVPLVPVLSRMERTGVLVDLAMLKCQSTELALRMAEVEELSFKEAGGKFNLGSPKQIQEILFGQLKLPIRAKTATGQPSTAEDVLQELALDYALPKLILEHRGLSKLKSTYTDRLPEQVNLRSGRVHTSYHQAVAATGRLSSSDPNLQNIPVRTAEGRRIRQAFIASPGYRLLAADYSQIELRIMAHLSGDPGLVKAFVDGEDVHRATAAEIMGVPLDQVTGEARRSAKAINFGLIYGMSAFGLAKQLGIDRGAAQTYVDRYFARYPGVKAYMDATRENARERGFVETVFGRRLYIPDIKASNAQRRQYAERTAINAPMQGTAADVIKRAMLRIDDWLISSAIDARMIMQVHDELVFEVAADALDEAKERIRALMEGAAELSIPLLVEIGVGSNWDEAH